MASDDRHVIDTLGQYVPKINYLLNLPNDEYDPEVVRSLLHVLRDEILEGFGRMERGNYLWVQPFDPDSVRVRG